MLVNLEIPEDLSLKLVDDPAELPRAALEGLALEAIRAGKLTVAQARRLLGIPSRYEMDCFLKKHGVFLNLTLDDVRADSEIARACPE
jgi:predicted HTH domain antitoxin